MSNWVIALLIKPLVLIALAVFVLYPARIAVQKWLPEGRVKKLLLRRVN